VGPLVEAAIAERFGTERSPQGRPSRADFESGPLVAARLQFAPETVEIAGFEDDPDYWDLTNEDPGH